MAMTKSALGQAPRDGSVTQGPMPILGGKVSKNDLPGSQPRAEQLALASAYFIKYEVSSVVRDNIISLRKKKGSCQYGFLSKSTYHASWTDLSSIPRTQIEMEGENQLHKVAF